MNNAYPIYEVFNAFQGEGDHMGLHAFFIRTFGCPIKCDFCDSAGTWHPKLVPKNISRLSGEELGERARISGAPICIVTGGEPTIHDLTELADRLRKERIKFHIETSGAFVRKGNYEPDWITLSPKWNKPPVSDWLLRANEIKLVVESPTDLESWLSCLALSLPASLSQKSLWIHPEWSKREDKDLLKAISEAASTADYYNLNKHGLRIRAGYQLHKIYSVDSLDSRSMPVLPLPKELR